MVIIKKNSFNYSVSMSQFYHGIREESSDEFCDQTTCERNILSYNFFAKPQNWRILQLIKRKRVSRNFGIHVFYINIWRIESSWIPWNGVTNSVAFFVERLDIIMYSCIIIIINFTVKTKNSKYKIF